MTRREKQVEYQRRYRSSEKGQACERQHQERRTSSGRAAEACARYRRRQAEARDAQRLKELTD